MSDFQQRGPITTLPRLVWQDLEQREREITGLALHTPVALVIPCLAGGLAREGVVRPAPRAERSHVEVAGKTKRRVRGRAAGAAPPGDGSRGPRAPRSARAREGRTGRLRDARPDRHGAGRRGAPARDADRRHERRRRRASP